LTTSFTYDSFLIIDKEIILTAYPTVPIFVTYGVVIKPLFLKKSQINRFFPMAKKNFPEMCVASAYKIKN